MIRGGFRILIIFHVFVIERVKKTSFIMFLNKGETFYKENNKRIDGKIAGYEIFVDVGEMELSGENERIAFGSVARKHRKYGSTSRLKPNEPFEWYTVQPGDTLPGLAIRFGITTEQIRRANQLWTNDSLYLRKKILIPCSGREKETEKRGYNGSTSSETETSNSNSSFTYVEATLNLSNDESFSTHHNHTCSHPLCDSFDESEMDTVCSNSVQPSVLDPRSSSSPNLNGLTLPETSDSGVNGGYVNGGYRNGVQSIETTDFASCSSHRATKRPSIVDKSEKSVTDFLSRIDSSIASSKIKVQDKSQNPTCEWVTFDSENDPDSDHRSGRYSITGSQGRQMRYSLRNLERTQNELFQL